MNYPLYGSSMNMGGAGMAPGGNTGPNAIGDGFRNVFGIIGILITNFRWSAEFITFIHLNIRFTLFCKGFQRTYN